MERLVFIIDDDPVHLNFLQEHFNQLGGYITQIFENADDAIKEIKRKKPFLVLLDNQLKDSAKDGIFYLKEIKRVNPKVPVVYMSSDPDSSIKDEINQLGVKSYIVKNQAFLVHLRTAIDLVQNGVSKKSLFKTLFGG